MPSLPTKVRPGLALDTSVSRHRAPAPEQVFPREQKTQELSFISLVDIKALKKQKNIDKARQRQLENVRPHAVQRSTSDDMAMQTRDQDVPPPYSRSNTTGNVLASAMHKRIKGLRPSPLDLSTDISPSDRAITIGLSVDPNNVSSHSRTPSSPAATQLYPDARPQRRPSDKVNGQEAVTPTIVITPAKEDFDFGLQPKTSPDNVTSQAKGHRPTSSIYSTNTSCMPTHGYTPPVPPLPLFALNKASRVRESNGTVFEEEACSLKVPKRGRAKNLSVCTVFEEDQPNTHDAKRLTSQSLLPTPRRSRGWWNLITSPFSASSKSNAFFWRSPPADDNGDKFRILEDASEMGFNTHAGIIFANRSPDDLDLRSAPPLDGLSRSLSTKRQHPKRSNTAPSALDPRGRDGVNIYDVQYVGAAAEYFNPHKNFPSIIMSPGVVGADRDLEGWSPSQSVYRATRGWVGAIIATVDNANDADSTTVDGRNPFDDIQDEKARALYDDKSPFSDAHASTAFRDFSGTHPAANANRGFFSTPATEELKGASPTQQPARPEPTRNETQGTMESYFSPLTATPVIEDARMGTLMGPSVVDVRFTPGRTQSPHASGLGAVTMASRGVDDERAMSEKAPFRHKRNDSYGLGIETDGRSMSEKSLFPPPKPLDEQPRLGTDRFGQLRIEDGSTPNFDRPPWYRRFLWPLAGLAAAALILLVVLLTLFVSQGHEDMPVQAQWLNLTGFPAMPTGVATVVQPKKSADEGSCVRPAEMWSCAVPSSEDEDASEIPDFRFEIRFRNKTRAEMNLTDLTPAATGTYRRAVSGASLANGLAKRSAWENSLFASLPAPPPTDDMVFLGNSTDEISEPFEGEETPFYISLLNASALATPPSVGLRLRRREKGDGVYPYPTASSDSPRNDTTSALDPSNGKDSDTATQAALEIPRPLLQPNGQPAPAQLYPLAHAQPLRLFNRGRETEHYGFYTYFDRSIYIHTSNLTASSSGNTTLRDSEEMEPNTPLASSNALCTFSQTRLHIQIWTRKPTFVAALNSTATSSAAVPAANSSANEMLPPGSFPYPVTITLDRHGGSAEKKGVFCYGLDAEARVMSDAKTWVVEDRGVGGRIVRAADVPGVVDGRGVDERDGGAGAGEKGKGIDAGDGGCACSWRNWEGR